MLRTRVAAALGAVCTSLVLVVATPTNAQATTASVPLAVSGAIRTIPTPVCTAGPLGAAVCGAAVLGGVAYATRDLWMPVLKGLLNGKRDEDLGGGTNTCTLNPTAFFQDETPRVIVGNLLYAGCTSGSLYVSYSHVTCRDGSGQEVTNVTTQNPSNIAVGSSGGPPGTASFAFTVCGVGLELVGLTIWGRSSTQGVGSPKRITKGYPESEQVTTTTANCKPMSGVEFEIEKAIVGTSERIEFPSCYAVDPTSYPTQIDIESSRQGGQPTHVATISSHPNIEDDYGDCFTELGLVCNVAVWISGTECTVGATNCVDWQQYEMTNPNLVRCKFGNYVVNMANCEVLRHAYRTTTIPVTTIDPATGKPTLPNQPPTQPEGCQVNCVTPPVPPDPETPHPTVGECLQETFSLNPVDWVVVPMKCVLTWAFVPTNAPSFSDVPSPIPSGWIPTFPSLSDGSCGPIGLGAVDYPLIGTKGPFTLVDTCDSPGPQIRAVTYYGLLAVMLVGLGNRAYGALTRSVGMGVEGGDDT